MKKHFKLNLPESPLPMRASLVEKAGEYYKSLSENEYQRLNLYHRSHDITFHVLDGPPYANGALHIGHAFNKVVKDLFIRYGYSRGDKALLEPCWDCYGLPIEKAVKQLRIDNQDNTHTEDTDENVASFNKDCYLYAEQSVELQRDSLTQLGSAISWQDKRCTMDDDYTSGELNILADIVEAQNFYLSYKPVHWCCSCQSSLAEAELEYKEIDCHSLCVKCTLINATEIFHEIGVAPKSSLVIWTTTPWTISENQGFAINQEAEYAYMVDPDNKEGLIVSREAVTKLSWLKTYRVAFYFSGSRLVDAEVLKPLQEEKVRCYHGKMVDVAMKHSTGIVHLAPAYGLEDFNLLKSHHARIQVRIGETGHYQDTHPMFAGIHLEQVSAKVITKLHQLNALVHHEQIKHSQGHCWRHKTQVIFRCTEQCFFRLKDDKINKLLKGYLKRIKFHPTSSSDLLHKMILNRDEWCVSRQRSWGVPMPIFVHKITGQMHDKTAVIFRNLAKLIAEKGILHYRNIEPEQLLHQVEENTSYYRLLDYVTDVWFDSGCLPLISRHPSAKEIIVFEGRDQYRGWFQSSLLVSSLSLAPEPPFTAVHTHGFIVDSSYNKMSKSIGNVVCPIEIISQYGVDVFRLWVASVDYVNDVSFSNETMSVISAKYRKLRNTLRFLLSFDLKAVYLAYTKKRISYDLVTRSLDKAIIAQSTNVLKKVECFAQKGEFHKATEAIYSYCNLDVSSVYITGIRDRAYTTPKQQDDYQALQLTILYIVNTILRALAPIIPYTVQESLNCIDAKVDVLQGLNICEAGLKAEEDSDAWQYIAALKSKVDEVLDAQKKHLDPKKVIVSISEDTYYEQLEHVQQDLKFILGCCEVVISKGSPNIQCENMPSDWIKCDRCRNYKSQKQYSDLMRSSSNAILCIKCDKQETNW